MKKQSLFFALLIIPFLAISQEKEIKSKSGAVIIENAMIPTKDGVIFYEQVAECTDDRAKLYLKARKWFVDTFKSAKSVIQMEEKQEGKLSGKAYHTYVFENGVSTSNVDIDFTLNLDIKDGKYRVQFYDMYGSNTNVNGAVALLGALGGSYTATRDATTIRRIEYNQVLADLTAGKRKKYNQKLLDGMHNEVKRLFASLETVMKAPYKEDF